MNRYAILNSLNVVVNFTVGEYPLGDNWIVAPSDVQIGWIYQGNGDWSSPIEIATFYVKELTLTDSGVPLQFYAGNHYANVDEEIQLSLKLADSAGDTQVQVTLPLMLKLPVVRHANGKPTDDEIYMNFTLVAGVVNAALTVKRSGDWKLLIDRVNEALDRLFKSTNVPIEYQFKISGQDVTIIA